MKHTRAYLALLFCICMAAGWTVLRAIDDRIEKVNGVLIVDATIETGDVIEAYINADYISPLVTPIVPKVRRKYSVGPIIDVLRSLRVDLGKRNGAAIEISSVEFFSDNKSIRKWTAEEIQLSVASQPDATTAPSRIIDGAVHYVQRGEGPHILLDPPAISADASQFSFFERKISAFKGRSGVLAGAILGYFLLLAVTIRRERSLVTIALAGAVVLQTIFLLSVLLPRIDLPDPVAISVGRAGFLGRSSAANQLTMLAALIGAVIVAFVMSAMVTQFRRLKQPYIEMSAPAPGPLDPRRPASAWISGVAAAIFCSLLAAYFLSNVHPAMLNQINIPFSGGWDANNVLLWNYLAHEGFLPLVDYWFPYGGSWMFSLKAPWGPLIEGGYLSALYANLFLALYLIFDRRFLPAAILVLIVLVGQVDLLFWAASRYLLATNITLCFVVLPRDRWSAAHLLFTVAVGLAVAFEPVQCFYATPGILVFSGIDLWRSRGDSFRQHAVRFARNFGPPLVVFLGYLAILAAHGMLQGFIDFHLSLGAAAYASAAPADLPASLRSAFNVRPFIVIAPFAIIAVAIVRLRNFNLATETRDRAALGLGLTAFMVLQKHILRELDWQLVLPSGIALLIWAFHDVEFRRWMPIAAGGLVSGSVLLAACTDGMPQGVMRQFIEAPASLASHFEEAVHESKLSREANNAAYSDRRLAAFSSEREVVARLDALGRREQNATVYVLGDTPILYILLRQAPPFQSNDYNASPVPEQMKVVSWLQDKRPAFVVWRASDLTFDDVPRVVRDPYIYSEVVANYVPLEQAGDFSILRLRRADEKPALDWWREKLTPVVDFGHLLHGSRMTASSTCPADTVARCAEVIKIDIAPESQPAGPIVTKMTLGDMAFDLQFAPDRGKKSYLIPVERLWFWKAADILGLTSQPKIELSTGATWENEFQIRSNNLY